MKKRSISLVICAFFLISSLFAQAEDIREIADLEIQPDLTLLGGEGPVAYKLARGHLKFNRLEINDKVCFIPPPPEEPIVIECEELYMGRGALIETSAYMALRVKRLRSIVYLDTRKDAQVFYDKEDNKHKARILANNPTGKDGADVSILVEKYEQGSGVKVFVNGRKGRKGLAGSPGGQGAKGGDGGDGGAGGYPRGAPGLGGLASVGGDGGFGADGKDGGRGGQGGTVTFNVLPGQKAPQTLYCSIDGGLGGFPGAGGEGGKGGQGGEFGQPGTAGSLRQAAKRRKVPPRLASSGKSGRPGQSGAPGIQGPRGAVKQVVRVIKGSKVEASVSH